MYPLLKSVLLGGLLLTGLPVFSQQRDRAALERAIAGIQRASGGRIGVAAVRFSGGAADTILFEGNKPFPMQSVYKLPLALTVLDQIAKGRLSLEKTIVLTQADLDSNTWSPMAKAHPEEAFSISIGELLRYTVSQSDNNACDLLFREIGGPKVVQRYLERNGITGIQVLSTEQELHRNPRLQYRNSSTPLAMLRLLDRIQKDDLVSGREGAFLRIAMTETENSPNRIKGALPAVRYQLAHKTGTSGTDDRGMTAAVNDVGIVYFKNSSFGIVVFVSEYRGDVSEVEARIATISRLIWDYYLGQ